MTVVIPEPNCQRCGHHRDRHDAHGLCRVVYRDDGEPCGCASYNPPRDDSAEIKRLRDEGFRV